VGQYDGLCNDTWLCLRFIASVGAVASTFLDQRQKCTIKRNLGVSSTIQGFISAPSIGWNGERDKRKVENLGGGV